MKKPGFSEKGRTPVIFIVSPPCSGSTLLAYLIATHPAVGTIGERKHFWRKMFSPNMIGSPYCSCGKLFRECEFWLSAKSKIMTGVPSHLVSLPFSNFQLYKTPILNRIVHRICLSCAIKHNTKYIPYPLNSRFRGVCEANKILIDAILQVSNATVFLDSSKEIWHAVYLDSIEQFDVYVINLLRDGRGHIFRMLKRHPERTIQELSLGWVNNINFQKKIITKWNGKSMTVRYEQLCAYPDETMRQIFTFCNLNPDQSSLRFRDVEQHIMGNLGTRTDTTNIIAEDQEWRSELGAAQLTVFDRIGGSLNCLLGYK